MEMIIVYSYMKFCGNKGGGVNIVMLVHWKWMILFSKYTYCISLIAHWGVHLFTEIVEPALIRGQCL